MYNITELCTRASQIVGILVRLRNLIPCNAKLMLYKTSILPYLTYCHLVPKFCRLSDSRNIECNQERTLRTVYKSQTETYGELLTRAKLSTLYNRRLQDITIIIELLLLLLLLFLLLTPGDVQAEDKTRALKALVAVELSWHS